MLRCMVLAIVVASLLGVAAAHALFLGWWTLVPWGIGGVGLGYLCTRWTHAFATGVVYGYVMVFVFLIGQYTGTVPVVRRLPFFAMLAVYGAVCGMFLCFIGSFMRQRTTQI